MKINHKLYIGNEPVDLTAAAEKSTPKIFIFG